MLTLIYLADNQIKRNPIKASGDNMRSMATKHHINSRFVFNHQIWLF